VKVGAWTLRDVEHLLNCCLLDFTVFSDIIRDLENKDAPLRRGFASLQDGGKGLTYWADFLDLQCDGPVPWQKEILEGIDRCSKVVAFVDAAYLMSVNCLKVRSAKTRRRYEGQQLPRRHHD
jgi:hypothetical protein